MIDRNEQIYIVKNFNAYAKGANKGRSNQMDALFDRFNFGPEPEADELLKALKNEFDKTGEKKILNIADENFIASLYAIPAFTEEPAEVHEEQPKKEPVKVTASEEKLSALGSFERVICETVVDAVGGALLEDVKPALDSYIKETYGKIMLNVEYNFPQTGKKMEGLFHEAFEDVLAFVMADEPVLLTGPAGTGKNVICKQVAEAMDLPFYFSNAVTQEYKLTGFTDANGCYQPSQFYKAFTEGGVFMLDEMDASIPEVLIILNAAIANRYFDFPAPIGKVEANENFRVVAAANTYGTGADVTYTGRYQLDGASLDRFAVIEIGYSERIENAMTSDQDLLDFFRDFRDACQNSGVTHIVSYRALKRMDKMSAVLSKERTLKTCLLKNLEKDDIAVIQNSMRSNNAWSKALSSLH